jgi:hypothetical protein
MNKKAKVLVSSCNFVDGARELYNKYAEEAGQPAFDHYKIVRHDPILIRVAEEYGQRRERLCHERFGADIVEIPGTKYLLRQQYHMSRSPRGMGGWTTEVLTPETMKWVSVE